MPQSQQAQLPAFHLTASAGMTTRFSGVSEDPITSFAWYSGGTLTDVDDLTGATAHTGVVTGGTAIEVDLVCPTGGTIPLRTVVDGAVVSVGHLTPTSRGSSLTDTDFTLGLVEHSFAMTVLGAIPSSENMQDVVGAMFSGNTETGIAATYDDTLGKVNLVAEVTQAELDAVSGAIPSTEAIQDIVGGMVSGGTETGVAVSYDDTNGRLDFVAEVTQAELDALSVTYAPLDVVQVEDPGDPGTYIPSTLYVGETDPAVGGPDPYIWIDPADIGSPTAAEILAALLTVDGAGSGLDADLLDGQSSAAFETPAGAQAKADAKVTQNITNGTTTTAPSEDAVFDALALKAPLASPTFTGDVVVPDADAATEAMNRQTSDGRYAPKATFPVFLAYALSDETTAITTGTAKLTVRAPFAFTLTAVRASLNTASSSGIPTVDINEAGTTVLSTKLTIDASELTSVTAAAAAVISDSAIADDAELTFDIDVAGTGAKGLKVYLYGTRVLA